MTRVVRAFKKVRMWTYYPDLLARPVPRYTSYPTAAEFGDIDTGLYRQALSQLRRQGQPARLAHQTPQEYLAPVSWDDSDRQQALERLTEWAYSAAYDPGPLPDDLARRLLAQLAGR